MIHIKKNNPSSALLKKLNIGKKRASNEQDSFSRKEKSKPRKITLGEKKELVRNYHNKCAYCEQKIDLDACEIDYYRPEKLYPWLNYEWSNWFPICKTCNLHKGDKFPLFDEKNRILTPQKDFSEWVINSPSHLAEHPLLLSPEVDDPEKHLSFTTEGEIYPLNPNDQRAKSTIDVLQLDRKELNHLRKEFIERDRLGIQQAIKMASIQGSAFIQEGVLISASFLTPTFEYLLKQTLPSSSFSLLGKTIVNNFRVFLLQDLPTPIADWVEKEFEGFFKQNQQKQESSQKQVVANDSFDFDSDDVLYEEWDDEGDEERVYKSFKQVFELVQSFWKKIDPEMAPELEFVTKFIEDLKGHLESDFLECLSLLQVFLKQWKKEETQIPNDMIEDVLNFSFEITTHYNEEIAPLCRQPEYSRLSSLEFTQSSYQESEHQNALPLSLRQIAIADFQCIDRVQLFDLPINAPWVIIVGENGDGKTSFLQAIALACSGDHGVHDLFHKNTEIDVELYQKKGEQKGSFRYFLWDQKEKSSNTASKKRLFKSLDRQLEIKQWDQNRKTQPGIPYILGYSSSRLKAEKSLKEGERDNPVHNLLRQEGSLEKFEEWLQTLERKLDNSKYTEEEKEVIRRQSETSRNLLCELMLNNIGRIEIQGENVLYYEKGKPTRWDHLSTGHKSMIAMVGDLLIRLFASQPTISDPSKLQGIVLIDEIETHLHPKWEVQFPILLSKCFPKVQFIGSSHSALPLLGIPEGSVILKVSRDNSKQSSQVRRLDIDLANLNPNLILTSPVFDLEKLLSVQNKNIDHVHTHDSYEDIEESQKQDQKLREIAPKMEKLFTKYLDDEDSTDD